MGIWCVELIQFEDQFCLLDWKLFDLFDFVQQELFAFRVEECTFPKHFLGMIWLVIGCVCNFWRNEASSFWNSAIHGFANSFTLRSEFSSDCASDNTISRATFVFLEFFLNSEIFRMIDNISDTDRSRFHSGIWSWTELLNFLFELFLTFQKLLDLVLRKLKFSFQLLNFRLKALCSLLDCWVYVWTCYSRTLDCFTHCWFYSMFRFGIFILWLSLEFWGGFVWFQKLLCELLDFVLSSCLHFGDLLFMIYFQLFNLWIVFPLVFL